MQGFRWRRIWRSPKGPFIFVLGGGIVTCLAVLALLFSSLHTMATKTDELAAARDRRGAQTLVDVSMARLTSAAAGMAAVRNLPGFQSGKPASGPSLFDEHMPVDGFLLFDKGLNLVQGSYRDLPIASRDLPAWQASLAAYVPVAVKALSSGHPPPTAFIRTSHGLAMVTVMVRNQPDAPYMAVTRHLNATLLKDLAFAFGTSTFRVEDRPPAHRLWIPLRDISGAAIGVLSWPGSSPGYEAAEAIRPQAINVGVLMGILVLFLVGTCLYGLKRVSQSEKDARAQALTDKLSGLPNRRALLDAIASQARRRALDQTVVFIDLDGFKDVNDIYGHDAGDELIVEVAKSLTACLPRDAMLARLGGDEFAVLTGGSGGLDACRVFAELALQGLKPPLHLSTCTVRVGASIGIAHSSAGQFDAQELFRRADMAMYHSKKAGKGRVTEYDGAIDTARTVRRQLEAEIRCGLDNGEFDVAYQPICNAMTHRVEAVEALVRWPRRPDGDLPPDAFISVAENGGIIHRLGLFVLQKACSDLSDLPAMRLHVNISAVQFRHPEFEAQVRSILDETGFPPARLELEITERHMLENPDRARTVMTSLASTGIGFALDDFGAGVSGIGHLGRFGLRHVKIDRALVATLGRDPQAGAFLTGAVSIAHALSLAVVAEGVETEAQEKLLRVAGCDLLQGYLFGRPVPFHDMVARLAETGLPAKRA